MPLLQLMVIWLIALCLWLAPSPLDAQTQSLYTWVNPQNYFEEVRKASVKQPVLVLFETDNCVPKPECPDAVRNIRVVYDRLAREFRGKIKFVRYPVNIWSDERYVKENLDRDGDKLDLNVKAFPSTALYIDGRLVDMRLGGPATEKYIGPIYRNMKYIWLERLFFHPENFKCSRMYENTMGLHEVCP